MTSQEFNKYGSSNDLTIGSMENCKWDCTQKDFKTCYELLYIIHGNNIPKISKCMYLGHIELNCDRKIMMLLNIKNILPKMRLLADRYVNDLIKHFCDFESIFCTDCSNR